ncbi:MAG: cell wall-binding repeat-containing protein [Actinomycetota bacterium]|jgi:putative cell wall-binding protein|nr:cell wall-binding repeat-containing protein [Actinomycetota bacterium]
MSRKRSRSRPTRVLLAGVLLATMSFTAPATLSATGDYTEAPQAPFNMTVVGHDGGLISSIEDIGGIAYALAGQGLNVYQADDRGNLELLGSTAVREAGGTLYADTTSDRIFVVGDNGFSAVDISVDESPVLLGTWDMPSTSYEICGFYVVGNYAYAGYVNSGTYGLKIFNVADATHPDYVAYVDVKLTDMETDVEGKFAYAQTANGFIVIDNSSALNPTVVADPRSAGTVTGLEVEGSDIFVSYTSTAIGSPGGYEYYSTADPELLVHREVATEGIVDIAVFSDSVWMLGASGVPYYYMGVATFPEYISEGDAISGATEIECNGGMAEVLSQAPPVSTLSGVYGVMPTIPYVHDTVMSTVGDEAIVFGEGIAFVAGDHGLRTLDITNPGSPVELDRLDVGSAHDVVLFGDTAYVALDNAFVVVDVTDPTNLAEVAEHVSASDIMRLAAGDGVLYAATDDGLEIFDVSDPGTSTSRVAVHPTSQPAWDLELEGSRLVLAYGPEGWNDSAALLFNVATPTSPAVLDEHTLPGGTPELSVMDGIVYVGLTNLDYGSASVKVFDISNGTLNYTKYLGLSKWGASDVHAVETGFLATGQQTERWNTDYPDLPYMDGYLPLGAERMDLVGDLIGMCDPESGVTFALYDQMSDRSFGTSRYDTAVSVSQELGSADTVVLATGRTFPDALAGAPLAYALDAPILLVDTNFVPQVVLDEIARLGATNIVILGGTGAVSNAVIVQLIEVGIPAGNIDRIAGASRYETCKNIALELEKVLGDGTIDTAFIATGLNFPDALAASGIAAKMGAPILLVGDTIGYATQSAVIELGITDTVVLGGQYVVGPSVWNALPSPERLYGTSRYDTAAAIADYALNGSGAGFTAEEVFVATGGNFPDALGAGVLAAMKGSPTVLTDAAVHPATRGFLTENKESIERMAIIGGPAAISSATERTLVSLVP